MASRTSRCALSALDLVASVVVYGSDAHTAVVGTTPGDADLEHALDLMETCWLHRYEVD